MQIKSILGLPFDVLKYEFVEKGFSVLDAKRVYPWIHPKLAQTFEEMSDVPKQVRERLPDFFSLVRPMCKILQESTDGTSRLFLSLKMPIALRRFLFQMKKETRFAYRLKSVVL